MPKSFAFLFSSEATIGDIVLESMMSESFFAFLNKPKFYMSYLSMIHILILNVEN